MKKNLLSALLLLQIISAFSQNQNVGIGTTTPDASAILDLTATDKGFLAPRLTSAQRTAIATPANGLLVYDVTVGCYFYYNSAWFSLCQLSGPTGAQGNAGATGPQGTAGTPGANGSNGAPGVPGAIGATGANGAPGVAGATGAQGVPGITGPQGVTGTQGVQGNDGPTGAQGIQGVNGIDGATGIQGIPGNVGATGPQGIQGPSGINAASGAQGAQGPQGIQGITGPTGVQGIQGFTGVQGQQGVQGITGAQGIQGFTGAQGIQGVQGITGAQGIQGVTGIQGVQGIQGVTGNQGIQGVAGVTGVQGASGSQGIQGVTGSTGPSWPTTQVNQTAAVTVNTIGAFVPIPGLTQTITLTSPAKIFVTSDGGVQTNSASGSGYSVVDIVYFINGVESLDGGFKRLNAINNNGLVNTFAFWSMSDFANTTGAFTLGAGTYTITVQAELVLGSSAIVGGDNTVVLQGVMQTFVVQ